MSTTLKKSIKGLARRAFASLHLRDVYSKLATSRAFGSSWGARVPLIARIIALRTHDPKALIGYTPPIPKMAKNVAPGLFRQRPARMGLHPVRAEVDLVLKSVTGQHYLRLTNGQLVRAFERPGGGLVADTESVHFVLRPEDLKGLATQTLHRL